MSEQTTNKKDLESQSVERMNNVVGNLDKLDGIDCQLCKNKGYIWYVDDEHPFATMKQCECMNKRESVRNAKRSGLNHLLDKRLNDFVVNDVWQNIMRVTCVNYLLTKGKEWLTILGQSGSGKTHLASAVANVYLSKGVGVRYTVWPELMKQVKSEMFDDGLDEKQTTIYKIKTIPVLYIDDLFKGKISDADKSITYEIINYRYNNALTTLITSEFVVQQLRSIDEAIAGRIVEMSGKYLLEVNPDKYKNYRFNKNQEGYTRL